MNTIFCEFDSCEPQTERIDYDFIFPFRIPQPGTPFSGCRRPANLSGVSQYPAWGDALVTSDDDHDRLEDRLRRARADLERRIHAGDDCCAEEYFAADREL